MWRVSYFLVVALSSYGSQPDLIKEADRHPDSFSANHSAGEFYLKQHNLAAALPYLEIAWRLNPSDYTNGYDLALGYLQTGSRIKCREVLITLLKITNTGELHNLLGDLEEADEHTDAAAREYETAARMDPTEKNLFDLGSDLLKHKGFEAAFKVFTFGAQKYPQSAEMLVSLGIANYSLGQYDEAVKTLCHAVDQAPGDKAALEFLGKMAEVSPSYAAEVETRMASFVKSYPSSAAARYYYAISLRSRSLGTQSEVRTAQAKSMLVEAVELDPQFTDAHFTLGLLYEDSQENSRAIREFRIVVVQRPSFLNAHYRLARLYAKSGKRDLAAEEFSIVETLKTVAH